MLAISVREGIKDAVAAFGGEGPVELAVPSTGEAVFLAIRKRIAA
jgi:xanthine dehydrogenase large subunit